LEAADAGITKMTAAETAANKMSTASAIGPSPYWLTQSNKNGDC
jgi:hypothetical protein